MKKKIFIAAMFILAGSFLGSNIVTKHANAACVPDPSGGGICPVPAPVPGSTIDTKAPAPNTIHENPPSTTWPGGGAWVGGKQPFFDVGNDTAYGQNFNNIPIYLRAGDKITVTITNASPDCQATDAGTGLKYPDYSTNFSNAGPPTTYSIFSNSSGTIRGPKTEQASDPCSDTVDFTDPIPSWLGDPIRFNNGQPVDANGISGSGYVKEVYLHVSVIKGGTIQGENAFRVQITNTSNDSELASGSDAVGYGYREAPLAYGNVFTQEIVFGPDESCSNFTPLKDGKLQYTDMDANNLNWNPAIRIVLQRESWKNGAIDGFSNWNTIETISNSTLRSQVNSSIHTLSTQQFDFHFRYRLLLENVGVRNTIFIGLTGDISQISGKYHLTGDDCSIFSCTATPTSATQVQVVLKNEGPFPAGKGFQLRQGPDPDREPASGLGSSLAVGDTTTLTFTRTADVNESYTLYDGTGNSAQTVSKVPLCQTVGTITVTCNGSSVSSPAEVGQTSTFSATFHVVNTTPAPITLTYGHNNSPAFTVTSGPTPASSIVNPTTSAGINEPVPPPVTYKATINYSGSFVATATYTDNGIVTTISCPPTQFTAVALPYFQVWNSDVSSGGGFASPNFTADPGKIGSCGGTTNNPPDPPYISPATAGGDKNAGGIKAFATPFSGGSSSDFGILAMGSIAQQPSGGVGFFSQDAANALRPVFSNLTGGLGGYLNGSPANGCIKDYFTDTRGNPTKSTSSDLANYVSITGANARQYIVDTPGPNFTLGTAQIPAGQQLTLYVDGNVTIDGNITTAKSYDPTKPSNVPYFALIVRGNITLTSNVTELDGVYVAQPTPPTSSGGLYTNGIFATCNDGSDSQNSLGDTSVCDKQLVVNGAVIAQKVELLHNHGTLHSPVAGYSGSIVSNPAEIFNYEPSLIIGSPAFVSQPGSINGIFSLSPVF